MVSDLEVEGGEVVRECGKGCEKDMVIESRMFTIVSEEKM